MSDPITPAAEATAKPASVADKLRAAKAARSGYDSITLPESGVVARIPKFKPYDAWAKAQRLGGKDQAMVMIYFVTALVRFDGERLTVGDYRDLISASDHLALIGKLYGGDETEESADEGAAGN